MKLWAFRFSDNGRLTDSYHGGGSAAVMAETRGDAEALVRTALPNIDWAALVAAEPHEAAVVVVFPDAGCC